MRNKVLTIFAGTLLFVLTSYGQERNAVFSDGTTVVFENKLASALAEKSEVKVRVMNILSSSNEIKIVHRMFVDRQDKSHFGYDLEIKKDLEKGIYTVAFKPLSIVLFVNDSAGKVLPKFPAPFQLNEGDTVSVDLLENPKTKEKIADLIKIVQGEPNQKQSPATQIFVPNTPNAKITQTTTTSTRIYSSDPTIAPKDFTLDEIRMQIANATLSVNGTQIIDKKTVLAGNLYFYVKGKGRFILSPVPRAGFNFQKVGMIEANKILFEFKGDKYEISALMPIMCLGGKWNLWVLHEPDYRPNSEVKAELGGGNIEFLTQVKNK